MPGSSFLRCSFTTLAVILLALLVSACGLSDGPGKASPDSSRGAQYVRQQLVELAALPCPAGVSAKDWTALKSGLQRLLEQRLKDPEPLRQSSHAPDKNSARVTLSYDDQERNFDWGLHNPGDYDQNGEVNVSDLTPLGLHLGELHPAAPPEIDDSIQAVVDGDGNGEINLADLTPIGANFGQRITDFYVIQADNSSAYPASNSEENLQTVVTSVAIGEYSGNRAAQRIHFFANTAGIITGYFYWVRPYDSTELSIGTPSNIYTATSATPVALLSALPPGGSVPLTVTLNAIGSHNSTPDPLRYFWDPEGDGTFYEDTDLINVIYTEPGQFHATVKVLDSAGGSGTASVLINAGNAPIWHPTVAIVAPADCMLTSGAGCLYQGGLVVCASSLDTVSLNSNVMYNLARSNTGEDFRNFQYALTSSSHYGPSMDVLNTGSNLLIAAASDAFVFTYTNPDPYATPWNIGGYAFGAGKGYLSLSAAMVAGQPSLASTEGTPFALGYDSATDGYGLSWVAQTLPVPGTGAALYASLAEVNGAPAIAYFDPILVAMRYIDSTIIGGAVFWNSVRTIAPASNALMSDGLIVLADGSPALVYHDAAAAEIRIARALDSSGLDFSQQVKICDTNGDTRIQPSAVCINGIVHVVFANVADGSLTHSQSLDSSALLWSSPDIADVDAGTSFPPDIFDAGGFPAAVYPKRVEQKVMFSSLY